jgi:anti-anti-sigma factor
VYELGDELHHLAAQDGCRKMVLSLGPPEPQFLYSVFLAKLVTLQRRLQARGGKLKIADTTPETRDIFDACGLTNLFDFAPDRATALASFAG